MDAKIDTDFAVERNAYTFACSKHRTSVSHTQSYSVLFSLIQSHSILLNLIQSYSVLLNLIQSYSVLLDFTQLYSVLLSSVIWKLSIYTP